MTPKRLLKQWIKTLKLQDWDIRLELVKDPEALEGDLADCSVVLPLKRADIRIRHPKDPHWAVSESTFETALVHELLHVHLWPFAPDAGDPNQFIEEQFVDLMSTLLVSKKE